MFSIHGIRTLGHWQEELEPELTEHGWSHQPYQFGYFPLIKFLRNRSRKKVVEDFHDWYIQKSKQFEPNEKKRALNRPSIIAHSFGSYVVGECMLKYCEVKFDKVILCGSILPREFDWLELLGRNQVWHVRNEFGLQDLWAKRVGRYVPRTGDSGYAGFELESPRITQQWFDYHEHSDYFRLGHCKVHWIPFLEKKSLRVSMRDGVDLPDKEVFKAKLKLTHALDLEIFGHLPGFKDTIIPRLLVASWIDVNPDIYTFLFAEPGNRLVGYVNAMPVREEVFKRIVSGELNDNEITADDLVPFDRGGPVHLYLMSIVIEPRARRIDQGIFQEVFELLVSGVEDKILAYWRRFGTRVVKVAATGWTPEGRHICEALGLVECAVDRQGNPIYALTVDDAVPSRGRFGKLISRIKARYDAEL
jgi:pimeloyl-ACP methyl ester carboxylesterase